MKALCFDIGGVVIRDRGLKQQVQAAFPAVPADVLWHGLNAALLPACRGQTSLARCWLDLGRSLGVPIAPDAAARLWDGEHFRRGIEVDAEVIGLLDSLRGRYRLAVISNTVHEHATVLRELGVYDGFDAVILSHEVGLTKDQPAIFELALGRLQVEPQQAFFIDDFAAYVELARGLGLHGAVFTGARALEQSLAVAGIPITRA